MLLVILGISWLILMWFFDNPRQALAVITALLMVCPPVLLIIGLISGAPSDSIGILLFLCVISAGIFAWILYKRKEH